MSTQLSGDAQVQDNQARAAALGVNIPGVGGGSVGATSGANSNPVISATGLQDNPSPISVPSLPQTTGYNGFTGATNSAFQSWINQLGQAAQGAQQQKDTSLFALIQAELGGGPA